jgi:uncharacterized damage-inducible protein DinB
VLQNRVHTAARPADYADLDSILPLYGEATDRTLNVLHTADQGWFVREGLFSVTGREAPQRLVPSLVVLHVLTHEFHHKGQITAAARAMGHEPPDLDFL